MASLTPIDQFHVDRMAVLASRIHDPDLQERQYASEWLDNLWKLWEAKWRR